jgi:hypothetical protein
MEALLRRIGGTTTVAAVAFPSDTDFLSGLEQTNLLEASSKRIYFSRIASIKESICPGHGDGTLAWVMEHPEQFRQALEHYASKLAKRPASSTLGSYAVPIISILSYHKEIQEQRPELLGTWKKLRATIQAGYEDQVKSNTPSERQKKAELTFPQLCELRDALPAGAPKLLMSLYTEIPPVRADFGRCAIYKDLPAEDAREPNYVIGQLLHLADFKTKKTNDPIEIELPASLTQQIHQQCKDWLFVGQNGQPMTRGTFTSWANKTLREVTGKPFSLTLFRHIYLSRPDLDLGSKTLAERERLARMMGHSLGTQSRYYWKGEPKK